MSDIERTTEKKHRSSLEGFFTVCAENLPVMNLTGKSDPYVVVTLRKAGSKLKTRMMSMVIGVIELSDGHDMGVYNISSGDIIQFYEGDDTCSSSCPPVFFSPKC